MGYYYALTFEAFSNSYIIQLLKNERVCHQASNDQLIFENLYETTY